MRRIRGAVPTFSVYFQLIVLAAKVLTVLEIQDYGRHLASSLGLTPGERCQRSCNTPYLWSLKIPYLLV